MIVPDTIPLKAFVPARVGGVVGKKWYSMME